MSSSSFLGAAARQAHVLDDLAHRPWPPPEAPWAQAQTREDVLFAHRRADLADLGRLLPPGLPLDTHDGEGWLGIVAYRLANLRLRGLPPVPRLSFAQIEVRTYVTVDDRPGTWLCSLYASNALLVEAAKRAHRLPAYRARISAEAGSYRGEREGDAFGVGYRVTGEPFAAEPGSLEHFLTERYCLYTADGGRLYRAELHHRPWRLQSAEAELEPGTVVPVSLRGERHALFAAAQDVLVWPLEEL